MIKIMAFGPDCESYSQTKAKMLTHFCDENKRTIPQPPKRSMTMVQNSGVGGHIQYPSKFPESFPIHFHPWHVTQTSLFCLTLVTFSTLSILSLPQKKKKKIRIRYKAVKFPGGSKTLSIFHFHPY